MTRLGTSGFSFPDWLGTVYPRSLPKSEMLFYYENHLGFDTVEVNFTYYSLPGLKTIISFDKKTGEDFDFVVKAYKGMTHDPSMTDFAKQNRQLRKQRKIRKNLSLS